MLLADAGCDLIALEMLFDVETSLAMIEGALAAGLPVSLGLVTTRDDKGRLFLEGSRRVRSGKPDLPLAEALGALLAGSPAADRLILAIMHSEVQHSGPAWRWRAGSGGGPWRSIPTSAPTAPPGGWDTAGALDPAGFAAAAAGWHRDGAAVIGGLLRCRPGLHPRSRRAAQAPRLGLSGPLARLVPGATAHAAKPRCCQGRKQPNCRPTPVSDWPADAGGARGGLGPAPPL